MSNEQDILDNAPEGATHVDRANHYWKFLDEFGDFLMCDREDGWVGGFSPIVIRSLADIKRIIELETLLKNSMPMDEHGGGGDFEYNDGSEYLGEAVVEALKESK